MRKAVYFLGLAVWILAACGCGNANFDRVAENGEKPTSICEKAGLEEKPMKIQMQAGEIAIVYTLNGSRAARDLYAQLPLALEVENFSVNEKIFYPPEKLATEGTPYADAQKGTLAYYAPWGDVVMFYEAAGEGSGLYELGEAVSGMEDIEKLTGKIMITAVLEETV